MYDMGRFAFGAVTPVTKAALCHPMWPLFGTAFGRAAAAYGELLGRATSRHAPPDLDLTAIAAAHRLGQVTLRVVADRPFGRLLHLQASRPGARPPMLVVNPLSGHFSSLFEDFYGALLTEFDVYIAEWADAREVPLAAGRFGLDDQIDYVGEFIDCIGAAADVAASSQATVPALAAAALRAQSGNKPHLRSLTLIAGPIDVRINPNALNRFINGHPLAWFERNLVAEVPFYYGGARRRVFPGYLQINAYISASFEDQIGAHIGFVDNLIRGDSGGVRAHREFYDRFLAVMDLPAEFFADMMRRVFRETHLPRGKMKVGGRCVAPESLRRTRLMTVEAGQDDLAAPGQTHAAHDICTGLPAAMRRQLTVDQAGHLGLIQGRHWRSRVFPELKAFLRNHG